MAVILLSLATFQRNVAWQNETSLWQDTTLKSPIKSRPFNSLGSACAARGHYGEAIAYFETAIRNGSGPQEVHHFNLALAYRDSGQLHDAADEFEKAIAVKSDYLDAYDRLALVYKDLGRLDQAESVLQSALVHGADSEGFHHNLGNIYLLQKKYALAIDEYRKALKINSMNIDVLYNLALSYDGLNMPKDAAFYYQMFIDLAPPDYQAITAGVKQRLIILDRKAKK